MALLPRPLDEPTTLVVTSAAVDLVLTAEEAARHLRIGRTRMFALIGSGEVESISIGRLRRVPVNALTDYVARLQARGSEHR